MQAVFERESGNLKIDFNCASFEFSFFAHGSLTLFYSARRMRMKVIFLEKIKKNVYFEKLNVAFLRKIDFCQSGKNGKFALTYL